MPKYLNLTVFFVFFLSFFASHESFAMGAVPESKGLIYSKLKEIKRQTSCASLIKKSIAQKRAKFEQKRFSDPTFRLVLGLILEFGCLIALILLAITFPGVLLGLKIALLIGMFVGDALVFSSIRVSILAFLMLFVDLCSLLY